MPNSSSLLLLFCSILAPSLCCHWLRNTFKHRSELALNFTQEMGGPFTEQTCTVHFPKKLYKYALKAKLESKVFFIRESLKLISDLYQHENLTSAAWKPKKLEDFRSVINRQIADLNTCVLGASNRMDRKLRNYFRKLARSTLDRTGGSPESWELIRKETFDHLVRLHVILNSVMEDLHVPAEGSIH